MHRGGRAADGVPVVRAGQRRGAHPAARPQAQGHAVLSQHRCRQVWQRIPFDIATTCVLCKRAPWQDVTCKSVLLLSIVKNLLTRGLWYCRSAAGGARVLEDILKWGTASLFKADPVDARPACAAAGAADAEPAKPAAAARPDAAADGPAAMEGVAGGSDGPAASAAAPAEPNSLIKQELATAADPAAAAAAPDTAAAAAQEQSALLAMYSDEVLQELVRKASAGELRPQSPSGAHAADGEFSDQPAARSGNPPSALDMVTVKDWSHDGLDADDAGDEGGQPSLPCSCSSAL